ncbi:uncharacterized protein ARMOST_00273 [Armillaria ostoyae]|uniref:Uncharacterized protein n=1 Tax=Armillaria ostoyae TaxID=47428 RepID=A0A284QKM9_ARMOS|nr:uncharacterized protein ARMOST_00273 [Armillaria ostoyae]
MSGFLPRFCAESRGNIPAHHVETFDLANKAASVSDIVNLSFASDLVDIGTMPIDSDSSTALDECQRLYRKLDPLYRSLKTLSISWDLTQDVSSIWWSLSSRFSLRFYPPRTSVPIDISLENSKWKIVKGISQGAIVKR